MKEQERLYRVFDTGVYSLSHGTLAAYSTKRDLLQIYSEVVVRILLSCKEFKTLDDHAVDYLHDRQRYMLQSQSGIKKLIRFFLEKIASNEKDLLVSEKEVQIVKSRLEAFVNDGFLKSHDEIHENIKALPEFNKISRKPEKISVLGIPTRNRGELLTDCIESYLENFRQHNRSCNFHIVDDSDNMDNSKKSRQAVEELSANYTSSVLWIDRRFRYKMADRLANISGAPENIIRFSLLGDKRCDYRLGGSRNTLLLLAAGEQSVQVDDDIPCRITPIPTKKKGLALSSKAGSNEYWYYNKIDAFKEQEIADNIDFLSLHETLLGKHPGTLIEEHEKLNIDHMGGKFLENLSQSEADIAITYVGVFGDSGMYRHWQRLAITGNSFKRLVADESTYRSNLCTRQLLRGAVQTTISDGRFCMDGVIGLDTRRILPPFMTVQPNQDGVFSKIVSLCFQQVYRGYSPWAIFHDPPSRSFHSDLSHALSVAPLRTNDILLAILESLNQWPYGPDSIQNLKITGKFLHDLSQLSNNHFKAEVRCSCWQLIRNQMAYLQRLLNENIDAPDSWQTDVRQVLTNFKKSSIQENICIPFDLPGSESERLDLFQELVNQYGQLLIHWPAIWEAAIEIRKNQGID